MHCLRTFGIPRTMQIRRFVLFIDKSYELSRKNTRTKLAQKISTANFVENRTACVLCFMCARINRNGGEIRKSPGMEVVLPREGIVAERLLYRQLFLPFFQNGFVFYFSHCFDTKYLQLGFIFTNRSAFSIYLTFFNF